MRQRPGALSRYNYLSTDKICGISLTRKTSPYGRTVSQATIRQSLGGESDVRLRAVAHGSFYGFPRTKEGKIKIGCEWRYSHRPRLTRQTEAGNGRTTRLIPRLDSGCFRWQSAFATDGRRLSVPKTKYTAEKAVNLPKKAIDNVKKVLAELFPELKVCENTLSSILQRHAR